MTDPVPAIDSEGCPEATGARSKKIWKTPTQILISITVLWMAWCAVNIPRFDVPLWVLWLTTLGLFGGVGILLGLSTTGRISGIFINDRRLMSLSRFQLALWTLLILSAYFAIFIGRLRAGTIAEPLAIDIDWKLWVVMGISGTSLVGRSLITGKKSGVEPVDIKFEANTAAKALKEDQSEIEKNRIGVLYANRCIADAQYTDMFEGDEMRNTRYIDLAKLQMFFFTIIALFSYAFLLLAVMHTADPAGIDHFPEMSEGFVAVLGISHAGFLGSGGVTYTPTK